MHENKLVVVAEEDNYDRALAVLQGIFVKPPNVIAARHEWRMCKQEAVESVDQFVMRLEQLRKKCDFQNVTTQGYKLERMRDALIAGLSSTAIRLRLLENRNLNFQDAYDQGRA